MYNTKILEKQKIINILVRQASRWAIASSSDNSALIKTLHGNYGAGYLFALRDIASDNEIFLATGVNISELQRKIIGIQNNSTRNLISTCPDVISNLDELLVKLSST
jgi:hypothetical protein